MKKGLAKFLILLIAALSFLGLSACGNKINDKEFTKFDISITLTDEWKSNLESDKGLILSNGRTMFFCSFGFDDNQEGGFLYTYGDKSGYVTNDEQMMIMAQAYAVWAGDGIPSSHIHQTANARFAYAFFYNANQGGVRLIFQTADNFGYIYITITGILENFDQDEVLRWMDTIKANFGYKITPS